jgi:hypothetical protein
MQARRAGFHLLAAYLIALATTTLSMVVVELVFGLIIDKLQHHSGQSNFWPQTPGPELLGGILNIVLVAAAPILVAGFVVLKRGWRRLTQFMIAGLATSLITIVFFCAVLSIREFAPLLLFVLRTLGVSAAIGGEAGAAAAWFYLRGAGRFAAPAPA